MDKLEVKMNVLKISIMFFLCLIIRMINNVIKVSVIIILLCLIILLISFIISKLRIKEMYREINNNNKKLDNEKNKK